DGGCGTGAHHCAQGRAGAAGAAHERASISPARMGEDARFAGRTAAVTGAGGFIGGAICRALAAAGADVRGLDVDAAAGDRVASMGAAFIAADVTDPEALASALEGVELAVHAAAL